MSDKDEPDVPRFHRADIASHDASADAVLRELKEMLRQLLEKDENSSIDLLALPLSSWDYDKLREVLGIGGIQAEVSNGSQLLVEQTGIPGIWWISQFDEEGTVIGEFIEVNYCPEALIAPVEEVADGLSVLRARLLAEELRK